jgi:hypothetical protein
MAFLSWENIYYRFNDEHLIEATKVAINLLQKRAKKEKNPLLLVFAKHLDELLLKIIAEMGEDQHYRIKLGTWPILINLLEKLFPAPEIRFRQDLNHFFKGYETECNHKRLI